MALFSKREVLDRAKAEINKSVIYKSAATILNESVDKFNEYESYDIFLSHSYQDAEIILGIKKYIEDMNYSVYVDWIEDKHLDRNRVDRETAQILKKRMIASKCLFYVTTENSINSKWMPWELGYFDGMKNKVAILPVENNPIGDFYFGQEYLGLYDHVSKRNNELYIVTSDIFVDKQRFSEWIERRCIIY
ncbi:hypothetical protein [Clostridium butyricum]|uniref:hypothetical protein n=1 Tax=Clostridium butyricum TaxID=1492 RepID=UPI00374EAC3B